MPASRTSADGAPSQPDPYSAVADHPTVDSPITARLLMTVSFDPQRPGTVVMMLDPHRRAIAALNITGATAPESIHEVVTFVTRSAVAIGGVSGLIIGSERPGCPPSDADIDRWYESVAVCEAAGLALVEWYIVAGNEFVGMRDATGGPPIWRAAVTESARG